MSTVIAIANQKGGVGKTATAVSLAGALIHYKRSCLLVDLDAQATATRHLLGEDGRDGAVVADVLLDNTPIENCVTRTESGIDLVPSNLSLATIDIDLLQVYNREHRLRMGLAAIRRRYDFVIIDCPPNLGFTTVNAFVACTVCIVPIQCLAEAWNAVPRLMAQLKRVAVEFENPMRIYALPTFYERTNMARETLEEIEGRFESQTLPPIHKNVKIGEAFASRRPITDYDPTAAGALDYLRVAKELLSDEEETLRRRVEKR